MRLYSVPAYTIDTNYYFVKCNYDSIDGCYAAMAPRGKYYRLRAFGRLASRRYLFVT
jgi:hypothetical protein